VSQGLQGLLAHEDKDDPAPKALVICLPFLLFFFQRKRKKREKRHHNFNLTAHPKRRKTMSAVRLNI
jgi:hypothetical protein